jgi:chromosome segregation ATPase
MGEHTKEARAVADLLAPSVEAATRAASEIEAAANRASAERDAKESAQADVVRLERDLTDLHAMVTRLEAELGQARETATAATVHARHDVSQVKARVAGMLDSHLRDLVNTADEALSLEPPRVAVARENIDAIVREIERQAAWLRS